jgi:hypothetical protein
VIVLAPLLIILRRWNIKFGSCEILIGEDPPENHGINAFERPELIGAAVAGGLVA